MPHFDVRGITSRLGLKNGLKAIEKELGIKRSPIVEKFNGGDALTLWRVYRATGDDYYLKKYLAALPKLERAQAELLNCVKPGHLQPEAMPAGI